MSNVGWFTLTTGQMNGQHCAGEGKTFNNTDHYGFFERAGVITFLKTITQLKVWFDDILEATWIYEDSSSTKACRMKRMMTALRFQTPFGKKDKVSTQYRYEIGMKANKNAYIMSCTMYIGHIHH